MIENIGEMYTKGNQDNIEQAVRCLDEFTHNWCMNCKETESKNDLVFRCEECAFSSDEGKCLVKTFKCDNMPSYKNFGCMGDL